VRITAFTSLWVEGLFLGHGFPSGVPKEQPPGESLLVGLGQSFGKFYQLSGCRQFGSLGKITADDSYLVEMAYLNRQIFENPSNSGLSIDNYCRKHYLVNDSPLYSGKRSALFFATDLHRFPMINRRISALLDVLPRSGSSLAWFT